MGRSLVCLVAIASDRSFDHFPCSISGYVLGLVYEILGGAAGAVDGLVHLLLVFEHEGLDDVVVDSNGAVVGGGHHAVHEEQALNKPVEGDPEEEDVCEEFEQCEGAVDDPVGEPLSVIVLAVGLDSLYRSISGVEEANEVTQEL